MLMSLNMKKIKKKISEHIQRRREKIKKTLYKMEAVKDIYEKTDPFLSTLVDIYATMYEIFDEMYDWISFIVPMQATYRMFFDNIFKWIDYFNDTISTFKPTIKTEDKEKIEELEKRLKDLDLQQLKKTLEKAKEKEKEIEKLFT